MQIVNDTNDTQGNFKADNYQKINSWNSNQSLEIEINKMYMNE